MMRIIDMREATGCEQAFSIWNTVTDRFVADWYGDQDWPGSCDFEYQFDHDLDFTERIMQLLPDWAKVEE